MYPCILGGKCNSLVDMFFNFRYVFHRINNSYVTGRYYVTRKKNYMGFIIIYNDPLNSKVHVFHAMCIWKPEMKNIPNPLPMGGIF